MKTKFMHKKLTKKVKNIRSRAHITNDRPTEAMVDETMVRTKLDRSQITCRTVYRMFHAHRSAFQFSYPLIFSSR